ncbi:MAG: D-aminoacyl-tRNA deacylase, partial [Nanoarchaeota archaeon]
MTYKKFLIIASKKDRAGVNITTQLSQFRENPLMSSMKDKPGFDFYLIEDDILHEENLDLNKINNYDFIIFASKHESEKKQKTLSIHAPGNWRESRMGGKSFLISKTSALFQKKLFKEMHKKAKEHNLLEKYDLTLECTHHGPLIEKPCLFIEIGSTENEWRDRTAGFALAKAIRDSIETFEENPYREIAIGIGGPHYCPNFNKIQLNSNTAISHVIPSYMFPSSQDMVLQAIKRTKEDVDFVNI